MSAAGSSASGARVLGLPSLLALGLNGIVGVGIFFAPSEIAAVMPGPHGAYAFAFTAVLLLPVALAYGRLGSRYPEDGGPFVWARVAFGERVAFAVGFVAYVSAVLSTATVVSGLGQYLAPELGWSTPPERLAFQLAAAATLTSIVWLGLRPSAWVWSALTIAKLAPLCVLALLLVSHVVRAEATPEPKTMADGLWRAALIAVFPLQGFEIVPVPAGEVRRPARVVMAATVGSLLLAASLYVLLQAGAAILLPNLAQSSAPIVEAGTLAAGPRSRAWFAAGANVSAIGIAFGMFAMTPRYLAALGTPRLLGTWLAEERRGVPARALWITTGAVAALLSFAGLERLFVLSSLAVLAQYGVTGLALFRLARRRERGLGPMDLALAPLMLAAILLLVRAAEAAELAALGAILACGAALLALRSRLARGKS